MKPRRVEMINLKRNKAGGAWCGQASGPLQRLRARRTRSDGNSFPLGLPTATGVQDAFPVVFSWPSGIFSSKKAREFLEKRAEMIEIISEFQYHGQQVTLGN